MNQTTSNAPGQGKRSDQYETSARFIIISLVVIMLTVFGIFIAGKCTAAEPTGYLIIMQVKGQKSKVYRVTTAAAADTILTRWVPGFNTAAAMLKTVFVEYRTQNKMVYIERKAVTGTRPDGTPRLKRIKTSSIQYPASSIR